MNSRRGFTLIELLLVVAIVALLAVVVILALNPVELLRQTRDTGRLSDMANLNQAIALYQTDQPGGSLGTASTTYLSLIDPAATTTAGTNCAGISGLPQLPAIYSYHCAASSTLRLTNGTTGWLPVNLSSISSGSPLGLLPIDPTNTSSSRLYYAYTPAGTQFELTTPMEAAKDKLGGSADKISGDGGTKASVYETGTNLALEPLDYGDASLIGLWTFDEGGGTTAYDYSGSNATGSWSGTLGSQWTVGKVGGYAGNFNGSSNVYIATVTPDASSNWTISAWFNSPSPQPGSGGFWGLDGGHTLFGSLCFDWNGSCLGSLSIDNNQWMLLTITRSGNMFATYKNGAYTGTGTSGNSVPSAHFYIGAQNGGWDFTGLIDDVRVYNRALSAAEIQALYNGQK